MQVSKDERLIGSGFIKVGGTLTEERKEEIRALFLRLYSGPRAEVVVLSGPAVWTPIPTIAETIARLDRVITDVRRHR